MTLRLTAPQHPLPPTCPLVTGVVGYLKAGSVPSLVSGLGLGGALALCGAGELQEYKKTQTVSKKWTVASLVISSGIAAMMAVKCAKAKESHTVPAIFATSSLAVSAFYAYRLARHVKAKK